MLRSFAIAVSLLLAGGLTAHAEEGKLRRFGVDIDVVANGESRVIAGGAKARVGGKAGGDVWLGGAEVTLDADVVGNARVAGTTVKVTGPIAGDLLAAGATVDIANATAGSVRIIGARASHSGSTSGTLEVSAGSFELAAGATVVGPAKIDAGRATLAGTFAELDLRARSTRIDGTVSGPATITGFDIVIGPNARFGSDVTIYSSGEPRIDPSAEIKGKLWVRPLRDSPMMLAYRDGGFLARARVALMIAAGGQLAGLFFLWLGRGAVEDTIDRLVEETGWSGLVGVLTLIILPLAVGLLMVTLVGAPLGMFLLLALPLLLLVGLAAAGFGVGEFLMNRTGEPRSTGARVMMLLVGLLALAALGLIPYAGPAIAALATVFGFGAVLRAVRGRLRPAADL